MKFYSLEKLLEMIDGENRELCIRFLEKNKERFYLSPGSLSKHQNWRGGYIDHLEEVMSLAVNLYKTLFKTRKPDFTLSDALLVLFLHDLEKPFKYIAPKVLPYSDRIQDKKFIQKVIRKERFKLSQSHLNALKYIHGEGGDYSRTKRLQGPLAAFCHACDNISARVWFDYPKRG